MIRWLPLSNRSHPGRGAVWPEVRVKRVERSVRSPIDRSNQRVQRSPEVGIASVLTSLHRNAPVDADHEFRQGAHMRRSDQPRDLVEPRDERGDRFGAVDDRLQTITEELLLGFHAGSMTEGSR